MNCCGNKRTAWSRQQRNEPVQHPDIPTEAEQEKTPQPRMFEYTGGGSLRLEGAITRQTYHFRFPGDRLEVEYGDSFALMAEPALRILK